MVRRYQLHNGAIEPVEADPAPVLVFINPDAGEKKYLTEILNLDEHTLLSSLDPYELGRLEFEPEHVALIMKRPRRYQADDNFLFRIESVGLFMFADRLIILLSEDVSLFDGKQFVRTSCIKDVIIKLMYRSIIHFEEHLRVINMCSDELESEVNKATGNRQLINMFTLEKSLVYYLNAISSNGRVIEKLRFNATKIGFSQDLLELLDDIAIENTQCREQAQIYSQVLSGLMDARASVISNNLNVMMKNLNALVIAVSIPSFFAGVGGMSELSTLIGIPGVKWGYLVFVLTMTVMAVLIYFGIKNSERFWYEERPRRRRR